MWMRLSASWWARFWGRLAGRTPSAGASDVSDRPWPPLLPAALVFAAIMVGDLVNAATQLNSAGSSLIWPGNGVLLGVLMVCPPAQMPAYALIGMAGIASWNAVVALPLAVSLVSVFGKSLAMVAAAIAIRRRMGRSTDLSRRANLMAFAGIGVLLAPVAPAFVIALARAVMFGVPFLPVFTRVFLANALGVLVTAPLVVCLYREEVCELVDRARLRETVWVLACFVAVTVLIVAHSDYPLLFLVFPAVLVLTARLGFAGAAIGLPIVAALVVGFTLAGAGPLEQLPAPLAVRQLLDQVFLITVAATALSVGHIVAERRRLDLGIAVRETRARFAEAKLRKSESLHRLISENASDIVSRFSLDGRRLYVSPSVREILGWEPQEVMTPGWMGRVHPDDLPSFRAAGEAMRRGEERIASTYRYARADGSWAWIEARLRLVRDSLGEPLEYISNARDITPQKEAEQALAGAMDELSVLAATDGLTGIANRRRFDETLRKEWRRAMRAGDSVALLMIDADNFKLYNDVYGHQDGDACLRAIAGVLTLMARRPGDLAARYGGEEFALIMARTDGSGALAFAEHVLAAVRDLRRPHARNPGGVVTVSVGVAAMVPGRETRMESLVEAADAALYRAKSLGRNRAALDTDAPALPALPPAAVVRLRPAVGRLGG